MTIGLDTTVTVRLLVGEPARQAQAARRLLEVARDAPASVSDLVVGETYFVLRYHYRVPHPAALTGLRTLLADPRVYAAGVAREVLGRLDDVDIAPGLMDRLIHGDYAKDGAALVTFDRDAARLTGARLLEP